MADRGTSRAALLEIREERDQFRQGHRFLDEKRMLLAQEILRRLAACQAMRDAVAGEAATARESFRRALGRHGLEGIQVGPAPRAAGSDPVVPAERFLGVPLRAGIPSLEPAGDAPIPSLADLAAAFRRLLAHQVEMAIAEVDLRRLLEDYRRTERRVRALEDVLLPELDKAERSLADELEEGEREEAVGTRWFAGRTGHGES